MNEEYKLDLPILVAIARNYNFLIKLGETPESIYNYFSPQLKNTESYSIASCILGISNNYNELIKEKSLAIKNLAGVG